jgi:predicted acetyltransferase
MNGDGTPEGTQTTLVRRAGPDDRLPVFRMLELYQHDLSDIWDQDLDAHGEYGYSLDRYWSKPDCHPFVATVNGRYAGFALVDGAVKVGPTGHWMDQFFILKKYRRSGVGRVLARTVFDALPGPWEVGQMMLNQPAQTFWRNVISEYTAGACVEHELQGGWWEGRVQCFASTPSD